MSQGIDFSDLAKSSIYRRAWLLYKALEAAPLDRAIEIARAADEFVIGTSTEEAAETERLDGAVPSRRRPNRSPETATDPLEMTVTSVAADRVPLAAEQRERLLERLAAGATNPELAAEFGLSPKQVQGYRIGSARDIAKRRSRLNNKPQSTPDTRTASAEEVVRYLRQQDDVVVPQGAGQYLVNGRFQLSLTALIDRANRMRSRQGKADFKLEDYRPVDLKRIVPANGHATV